MNVQFRASPEWDWGSGTGNKSQDVSLIEARDVSNQRRGILPTREPLWQRKLMSDAISQVWDEDRLCRMMDDQVEENLHLDYRAAQSLQKTDKSRREIVKDVTSFANADGGVIIYGMSEFRDREKAHIPEKLDPVKRS